MLRTFALLTLFSMVLTPVSAQTVDDVYSSDTCATPLRIAVQESYLKTKTSSFKEAIRYSWCHVSYKTEAEAKANSYDVGVMYAGIGVQLGEKDAFAKALAWKDENCWKYQSLTESSEASVEWKTILNEKVAVAALQAYTECKSHPQTGLYCVASKISQSTATFFASFIPPQAGVNATVGESSVDGARRRGAQPEDKHIIFKSGTSIPSTGITATFKIDDQDSDVSFDLQTKEGFGGCSKVLPADDSYDVHAVLVIKASKMDRKKFDANYNQSHTRCLNIPVDREFVACGDTDYVADPKTFKATSSKNPENTASGDRSSCFTINTRFVEPEDGRSQCLRIGTSTRECAPGIYPLLDLMGACLWAQNHGTQLTGSFEATKEIPVQLPQIEKTWAAHKSGQIVFKVEGVPDELKDLSADYKVLVRRNRDGREWNISEKDTPEIGAPYVSFDSIRRAMVVSLP